MFALLALAGYLSAAGAPFPSADASSSAGAWFAMRGKVTRVIDGDTIRVRIANRSERVRLIGIDAPEAGGCYAAEATAALRRLVSGKRVTLIGDRTQTPRDRFKRLLAYVVLPNGVDAGRFMLRQGYAFLFETERPFGRYRVYTAAAQEAANPPTGRYTACTAAPPETATTPTTTTTATATAGTTTSTPITNPAPVASPSASNCHASYPTVCIAPPPPDLDCKDVPYRNFRVLPPDPHGFDGRDNDGIGCES